jgi:hypothetical protein
MALVQFIVLALLVESVWETAKMVWQEGKFNWERLGVIILGVGVCVLASADLFEAIGINLSVAYVGAVLTGIIASRGANFVHDLVEKLVSSKGE